MCFVTLAWEVAREADIDDEAERLNNAAYLALSGVYGQEEGETRLANLLRSTVPIDPIVREELARALSPNGAEYSHVRLRLANLQDGRFISQMKTQTKKLKLGQEALDLIEKGMPRIEAERTVAGKHYCSEHQVKKATEYARDIAGWDEKRSEIDKDSLQSRLSWQLIFHTAAILRITPEKHAAQIKANCAALDRDRKRMSGEDW